MRAAWVVAGLCLAWSGTAEGRKLSAAAGTPWSEKPLLHGKVSVPSLAPLVRATRGAVVSITTTQLAKTSSAVDALAAVAEQGATEQVEKGLGSGFIIAPEGLVLTNAHVIRGARDIQVTIDDGRTETVPAEVLGSDEATDVALLRVHAGRPLTALPLGDSEQVEVGEWVVAQGNPFGLSHTVSVGVISYVGRADVNPEGHEGFHDYLQTDTAINPGSSGGPLLDLTGRVVGIANSVNPAGQGIAFALPINMAKEIVPALLARGEAPHTWLGLHVVDLTPQLAESYGVRAAGGVLVADLDEKGPAAKGGLRTGDLVLRFDGHRVRHAQHLRWLAAGAPTDRDVPVEVEREGLRTRVLLRLTTAPKSAQVDGVDGLGARFAEVDVPGARAAGLAIPVGARVAALLGDGPAVAAGLRVGDVITRAGARDVGGPEDLAQVFTAAAREQVALVVHRGGRVIQMQLGAR